MIVRVTIRNDAGDTQVLSEESDVYENARDAALAAVVDGWKPIRIDVERPEIIR